MVLCVYFIIVFITCYYYNKHKYSEFIVSAFAICSKGFGLLPYPEPFKIIDIFSLILIFCIIKDHFKYKSDRIGKLILIIFLYEVFIACISIIVGTETLIYSIMVLRFEIYYLIYFVFKKIPFEFVRKGFNILFVITILVGILYYLQFIGITGILQGNYELTTGFYSRVNNKPLMTSVMLFYSIFYKGKLKYRWALILFFSGMIILSQNRGEMIAVFISILFAVFFLGYRNLLRRLIIPTMLFAIIFFPIVLHRFSSQGSVGIGFTSEVLTSMNILLGKTNLNFGTSSNVIYNEGTGIYRSLVVKERLNYLSQTTFDLFFGIGTVHENSRSGQSLNFYYGNINNDRISNIDTTDVAFLSHIMRYGLIYLVLYSFFIYLSFKGLLKYKHNELVLCCLLFIVYKLIQIPSGDYFSGINHMFFVLLILSQITPKYVKI